MSPLLDTFSVLIAIWIVVLAAAGSFFYLSKNVGLKRVLWAPYCVLVGALFLAIAWILEFPANTFVFLVPIVAVFTVLNVRSFRFCDACAAPVIGRNVLVPPSSCTKCGAEISR